MNGEKMFFWSTLFILGLVIVLITEYEIAIRKPRIVEFQSHRRDSVHVYLEACGDTVKVLSVHRGSKLNYLYVNK